MLGYCLKSNDRFDISHLSRIGKTAAKIATQIEVRVTEVATGQGGVLSAHAASRHRIFCTFSAQFFAHNRS
ncbi:MULTISPECIES: hypothetical protein [Roseobacteraceae]|nr:MULTISPECIES: hypothetical protein [Roseobacteraceae]